MYSLNKLVWMLANPLALGLLILGLGLVLKIVGLFAVKLDARKRRVYKVAWGMVAVSLLWFWLWGTKAWTHVVGCSLERDFLVEGMDGMRMRAAADYPQADAIVDLGGGCGANTNLFPCALLNAGADRAYFSALLWKAGKAPVIIPSGTGLDMADKLFLMDLGVPEAAIIVENVARNTEENAKFVEKILNSGGVKGKGVEELQPANSKLTHSPTRILLVTSAWHMKRSLLMFARYAPNVECIPAACDFECITFGTLQFGDFLPDTGVFECNCRYFHVAGNMGLQVFQEVENGGMVV